MGNWWVIDVPLNEKNVSSYDAIIWKNILESYTHELNKEEQSNWKNYRPNPDSNPRTMDNKRGTQALYHYATKEEWRIIRIF